MLTNFASTSKIPIKENLILLCSSLNNNVWIPLGSTTSEPTKAMKKIVLNLIFAKVGFYVSLSKDVLVAQWTDWSKSPRYKCNGRWDSRKPCASLVRFCWGDTKRTGDPNNGLYTWWYCNHKSSWNLEGGFDVWKYWKKEIFRNCLALQDNVNSSILKKRWAHRSCQGNRFDYHRHCCHKICWQFPITSSFRELEKLNKSDHTREVNEGKFLTFAIEATGLLCSMARTKDCCPMKLPIAALLDDVGIPFNNFRTN